MKAADCLKLVLFESPRDRVEVRDGDKTNISTLDNILTVT